MPQTPASLTATVKVTAAESVPPDWVTALGEAEADVIRHTAGSRTSNEMSRVTDPPLALAVKVLVPAVQLPWPTGS